MKWAYHNSKTPGVPWQKDAAQRDYTAVALSITIIMFAFVKACSLYGLLIVFLSRQPTYIWYFIPFTLIGILLVRPDDEFLGHVRAKFAELYPLTGG